MNIVRSRRLAGRHKGRGQALVEFALILPIFLFLLFAVIDAGRYVFLNSTLSNAAREAARIGSVEANWIGATTANEPSCGQPGGAVCPANAATMKTHMLTAANAEMKPFVLTNLYLRCDPDGTAATVGTSIACTSNSSSNIISVRVTATWTPLTPIISNVLGTQTREATATVVIN